MPKKRTPRQRLAAQQRARLQRRELARQEEFREQHTRKVLERQGDPRFVQRTRHPDGTATLTWDSESGLGQEMREGFQAQREAFRAKFGRDPGPEDPVFFDPDADEPTPMGKRHWDEDPTAMIAAAEETGVDPAFIHAWREIGYIVTSESEHLFSATEVQAYHDAVARHRDDDDDEEIDFADSVEFSAEGLRELVNETITIASDEPAWRIPEALEAADDPEAAGLAASTMIAVLMMWLTGAKENANGDIAGPAMEWIREHLGGEAADYAFQLAGLLGSPLAPNTTVEEAFKRLGDAFLPTLVWLAAGMVATQANGDVEWLSQFDPEPNAD
ncbi:hypothetical protein EDC02_2300 [Micromonospora sp. Llam0]|uniref:hypothetical protein n=1 Tax=Micromonospora sp. Llam0 TaxID=2485143 RepID=UPI000F49B8DD|nr:hypothetical protein [Micromonospora sp. Llam0]ROO60431.1 hypothetical protein EDC02_2300 [Micromonospora sp. Llam0]